MTDKYEALRARLAAATSGRWYRGCELDGVRLDLNIIYADDQAGTGICTLADPEADGPLIENAPTDLRSLLADLDAMTLERDAYRRAKQENDERFMLERDQARRERDFYRAGLLRYGCHDNGEYDGQIICDSHQNGPDTCDCGLDDALKPPTT